jgi:hypothetical protein
VSAPTYPTLEFLVRYGNAVAWIVALVPVLGGSLAWLLGLSIGYAIAGVVGGAFLFLIMRSYVELVRVIVDMLLPK